MPLVHGLWSVATVLVISFMVDLVQFGLQGRTLINESKRRLTIRVIRRVDCSVVAVQELRLWRNVDSGHDC
jgi:hypothetical protein